MSRLRWIPVLTEHTRHRPRQKVIVVSFDLRVTTLIVRDLDVHFVNPLPVMQRPAYRVWADTRHGRIVEAESLPTLVPVVVDGVCD
jgi:hypothetical protein